MGKRWKDDSHDVINVNSHPADQSHKTTDAWFSVEGSNWNYSFGGGGISYSSNRDGFNNDDVDTIAWQPSKGIETNDNIYLWNRHPSASGGGYGVVITDTTPYDGNYTVRKNITEYGIPMNYIGGYHVKKNDKPVATASDVIGEVNVEYNKSLNGEYWGFDVRNNKKYENIKLVGDTDSNIGKPCPGTNRVGFVEPKKIRCLYNDSDIVVLGDSVDSYRSSTARMNLKNAVTNTFCTKVGNEEKSIGGGQTCLTYDTTNSVARRYCEKGDNIKKKRHCIDTYAYYHESAKKYCDANPTDKWCGCYISTAKCSSDDTQPGCEKYKMLKDSYISIQNQPGYQEIINNLHCSAGCNEPSYKPPGFIPCQQNITVCGMTVNTGKLTSSVANLSQNCGPSSSPSATSDPTSDPTSAASDPTSAKSSAAAEPSSSSADKLMILGSKIEKIEEIEEKSFFQKYWWVILLLCMFGLVGGVVLSQL